MTVTEQMAQEMSQVLRQMGEEELTIPDLKHAGSELALLRKVKKDYTKRLLDKIPKYRALPEAMVPDMFLHALRTREAELESACK
jgi:hypothetical protein